jgi:hypothetical protein
MKDTELLDFIQRNGIQIWPVRSSRYSPVVAWYAQNVLPFIQAQGATVREALTNLKKGIDENTHA